MILIIGGAFQGKRQFAEQLKAEPLKKETEVCWCDGAREEWEDFCKAEYCFHLPDMVARRMENQEDFSGKAFADQLLAATNEKVIVGEEIGSGIVPIDAFQRKWREETGRIYCMLAAEASQVWRVVGGIGQRIK